MRELQDRQRVEIMAALGDLKEENYRLWLVVSALIDTLEAEGLVTAATLKDTAQRLEEQDAAVLHHGQTT